MTPLVYGVLSLVFFKLAELFEPGDDGMPGARFCYAVAAVGFVVGAGFLVAALFNLDQLDALRGP